MVKSMSFLPEAVLPVLAIWRANSSRWTLTRPRESRYGSFHEETRPIEPTTKKSADLSSFVSMSLRGAAENLPCRCVAGNQGDSHTAGEPVWLSLRSVRFDSIPIP